MRNRFRFWLGLVLTLAPVLGQFAIVGRLGINTLIADEHFYIPFIRTVLQHGRWLGWLPMVWLQHNEHRVVPMKLTIALLAPLTRWNLKAEMYVSAGLAALVVLGLWRLYRCAGGTDLLLFAPVAWLFCNLSQYENMLYGMQMCHYFAVVGVVWALVFLARHSGAGLALAILCGLLASLSILNGLLVWPVGFVLLVAWGERAARTLAWAAAGTAITALYFVGFKQPAGLRALHWGPRELLHSAGYAVSLLGAPLAAGSMAWSRAVGLALLAAVACVVVLWQRQGRERWRQEALPAALALFGLLSSAAIAAGRATVIPALESRYVAYTSLVFVGLYLLASRAAETSGAPLARSTAWVAALALLLPGIVAADLQGYRDAKLWHLDALRQQFRLQTFDRQPDAVLGDAHFAAFLRREAPYLRAERLNAFGEPQRLLLLTQWEARAPAGELLPGRPIEQRLVCPVDELWDAEVVLDREGQPDRSTVTVSIWTAGRRLAVSTLPSAAIAAGWVEIPLPVPLSGCRSRELIVRLESADATPATRLGVWSFPAYYDGELEQAGRPLAPGRSLGLGLNGFHQNLLE